MSRQRDIEVRLRQLRSEGAAPDTDWHRVYNEDVTYLVNVLKDYGPPLRTKLQQRSIECEQRESELKQARGWMFASVGLLVILGLGLLRFLLGAPGILGPASPSTAMSIEEPGSVAGQYAVESGIVPGRDAAGGAPIFAQRADGRFCSDWIPTGPSAAGGCPGGCQWQRVCTRDGCDPQRVDRCGIDLAEHRCGPWPGSCPNSTLWNDESMIVWAMEHRFDWDFHAQTWRDVGTGSSLQEMLDQAGGTGDPSQLR